MVSNYIAAVAAKSLQSWPTLCNPIDGITLNTFQSILGCVSGTFKLHILIKKQVFIYPCSDYLDEMIKGMRWEINSRTIFFVSSSALTWDAKIRITECIYTENYPCS